MNTPTLNVGTAPTDNEILEGSARAIGLEPRYTDAGDGEGYWTVPAAGVKGMRTTWNPLRQAAQSQKLHVDLCMVAGIGFSGADVIVGRVVVKMPPLVGGREATLRRAIALAAYQVWKDSQK
jgi:hypothetical protein